MLLTDDDGCFGCGQKNATGLRMRFEEDEPPGHARGKAFIDERFQGWRGIAHGGILATLLDDAMAYAGVTLLNRSGVMARLNVRFRKPAPLGAHVWVRAWVVRSRGAILGLKGEVRGEGGELLTSAEGTFVGKEPPAFGETPGPPELGTCGHVG